MSERDARDPYLGLNDHIRRQAKDQVPMYYTIGKVLSLRPMIVRAAGMNLEKDDLKIAQHLMPDWIEPLTKLEWPLTAELPWAKFTGECSCSAGVGTCYVIRPDETVEGKTTEKATVTHPTALLVGDEVILIPSSDGQMFYMVDKLVEVDM